jgi:hypothetical protein
MKTPWTPGEIEITASAGGYTLKTKEFGVIANVIQRDPHPVYGMGITNDIAAENAKLFSMVFEMENAIVGWFDATNLNEADASKKKFADIARRIQKIRGK